MSARIILITKTGCGPCAQFLAGPWRTLKDSLSYGIGGVPVEHIDVAVDGMEKIPPAVRRALQFVPSIYALYSDNTVDTTKNPINTQAGLKELQDWSHDGPPKYGKLVAAAMPAVDDSDDQRLEVVAVTSVNCGYCHMWEANGDLQRFLDSLPASVSKSRFVVQNVPPPTPEDARRRAAVVGIRVPGVIVVTHAKWAHPTSEKLTSTDILLSPGEVRSPEGRTLFGKWLSMLMDQKTPFLGYMLLATSASCGHCIRWKESGGMDQFVATNKAIPGILLLHNGRLPDVISNAIQSVPSVFFVPAGQWSAVQPDIEQGPDPRNTEAIASWVEKLTGSQGRWANDPDYVPQEYREAAAARDPQRMRGGMQRARRPMRRTVAR